jgi:hypothetical protein
MKVVEHFLTANKPILVVGDGIRVLFGLDDELKGRRIGCKLDYVLKIQ